MWRGGPPGVARCERCWPRETEDTVAEFVGVIDSAVRRAKPSAFTATWSYTNNGWERTDRVELVKRLPAGTPVMHHIDKDHWEQKAGYKKHLWDYSLGFSGIADSLKPVAETASQVGRKLIVKSETGVGVEVMQLPYVPAMQHLCDKWKSVRSLSP